MAAKIGLALSGGVGYCMADREILIVNQHRL